MDIERSDKPLTESDLRDLLKGSIKRIHEYFIAGLGSKWSALYDIERPLLVALCQGAAMHYQDKVKGVKDFDIWFFYPFNAKHLPYRSIWNWDYVNPKFGRHPSMAGYKGRKVDVLVRSIKNYVPGNPRLTIHRFLESENSASSRELAKKAVVLLQPEEWLGQTIWYKGKI